MPADCEVYGLFSDLLPAALVQDGGELQWSRARQGKVPDFRFMRPSPEGPKTSLAELKVISAGRTWYPGGVGGKGSDRRAALLTSEYERKLRDMDVRYLGAAPRQRGQPEPPPGPLLARFRALGGLDQGCPMSPAFYAAASAKPLRNALRNIRAMTGCPHIWIYAYLDDT